MANEADDGDGSQPLQYVILDCNIVHYWISKKMRQAITPVLAELEEANLRFAVSEISIYEAQCQLPRTKHVESLELLEELPKFPVDTNVHLVTGTIMSCYRDHGKTKQHADNISLQDGFNAATAILNNAVLLTADFNDYPRPFFDEVWHWDVQGEKGQAQKIYLLKPDTDHLAQHSDKWFKATRKQQPVTNPKSDTRK